MSSWTASLQCTSAAGKASKTAMCECKRSEAEANGTKGSSSVGFQSGLSMARICSGVNHPKIMMR